MVAIDFSSRINGEYRIIEVLSVGFSSKVCRVKAKHGLHLAAKFVDPENKHLIEMECKAMEKFSGTRLHGVPYWYYKGKHGNSYVLVMELFGNSIASLNSSLNGLGLRSVLMIGIQLIHRIDKLHKRGFIHRDIKPENFLVGKYGDDAKYIYLTDFGHALEYRDRNNEHKRKAYDTTFLGNACLASVHASKNYTQSRRCDLESLLYCLIYILKGSLPWEGRSIHSSRRIKERITAEELCGGLPVELKSYFRDVRALGYSERPDYCKLAGYLETAIKKEGYEVDNIFEWICRTRTRKQ